MTPLSPTSIIIIESTQPDDLPVFRPPHELRAAEIWYTEVLANFVNKCFKAYVGRPYNTQLVISFLAQIQQYIRKLEVAGLARFYRVPENLIRLDLETQQLIVQIPSIARDLAKLWVP